MNMSGFSDKGVVRSTNQDAYLTGSMDDGAVWAGVCDGMGGANGGNIASRLGVDHFSASLKAGYRSGMSDNSVRNLLETAVNAANIRVFDKSRESSELNGMGTTIVAVLIVSGVAYFVHAGDSRAYVYTANDGKFTQLTRDHSIVQSMIEDGKITTEEARFHPRKNVITRALGVDEFVTPEFNICDLSTGDRLLLCTDGLTNFVDADVIFEIVLASSNESTAEELINEANKNGGGDNITAVVIEI